jgi:hypothetical protein
MKRFRWRLGGCFLTVLLVVVAGIGFLYFYFPVYNPVNYDLRLTLEASTATPVIAALNRYRSRHSAFPVFASQLASYLPPESATSNGVRYSFIRGWYYRKSFNGRGHCLKRSLGWDPVLSYVYDGSKGRWVYNPGDGTPEIPIILKP